MVVYIVVSVALRGYFPAARPNLKMEIHSCHMLTSVLSLLLPSPACRILFYFIMLSHFFFFLILIRRKSNKEIGLGKKGKEFVSNWGRKEKKERNSLYAQKEKKIYRYGSLRFNQTNKYLPYQILTHSQHNHLRSSIFAPIHRRC